MSYLCGFARTALMQLLRERSQARKMQSGENRKDGDEGGKKADSQRYHGFCVRLGKKESSFCEYDLSEIV